MTLFQCMQTQSKCVESTKRNREGLKGKEKDRSIRSDARARDGEKREHANAKQMRCVDLPVTLERKSHFRSHSDVPAAKVTVTSSL